MESIKIIAQTDWEKWRANTFAAKEPETLAWIDDFKDDGVFWDIGANIGVYSLYCAHKHPIMTICAFEPLRQNFLRLWQNIFKNEFHNITAYYMAIGNAVDLKWFNARCVEAGSSGGQVSDNAGAGVNYQIPIYNGDYLVNQYCIEWPDYVKIDTDGNEYDVLLGMYDSVLPQVTSILVEENLFIEETDEILRSVGLAPDDKYNELKNRESDNNIIYTRTA